MHRHAVAIVLLAAAVMVTAAPVLAANNGYTSRTRHQAWRGINQNPWDFVNCFIWSPKHRNYFWLCGKPYPPGFAHR
ncbi:hypothetical protein [Bauldia litoralis]|uniref:Secreted protein n=1 Tax=Bauldia litoralis TaxID=665467 RepID=A0A1G6B5D5_9HYPH|nr:hypothetical protein [Bauldia litoralis]SDB15886.1 hypothetical protein SAMN02982931_01255 [Bauldia litoralis]